MKQSKFNSIFIAVLIGLVVESIYLYISRTEIWPFLYYQYDWGASIITTIIVATWVYVFMQGERNIRINTALITSVVFFIFEWLYILIFLCVVVGDCL